MSATLPDATLRFLNEADRLGLEVEPVAHPDGTKTAADAAAAIGCAVGDIVKSLVFVAGDEPVLVLIAGNRRVDLERLGGLHGGVRVRRATLDEVRAVTGYAAGGTPPVGHATPIRVHADVSLRDRERVWAAAGTPTTVFPVTPGRLAAVAGAGWVDVAEPV